MKKYIKPKTQIIKFNLVEKISSLNTWLSDNGLNDAGITTYVINS